jgi:hypothetical protein
MVEPQANEAYVDAKVAASVAVEATRAQTAEKSLSDRIDTKQAALNALQVMALNSGINAQRVFDIVSLAGGDSNTGKSVRTIAGEEMMKLVDGAPDTYDTLKEIADWIAKDETGTQAIVNQVAGLTEEVAKKANTNDVSDLLNGKVNKVAGKGLSTNDYTTAEKEKLTGIEAGAQKNPDLTPYAKKNELKLKRDKTDNIATSYGYYFTEWVCTPAVASGESDSGYVTGRVNIRYNELSSGWEIYLDDHHVSAQSRQGADLTELYWEGGGVQSMLNGSLTATRTKIFATKAGEPYVTPTGVKNIAIPKYKFVDTSITDGVVTVAPYTNAKLVSDGTAFSVVIGGENGYTRDCVLRVECGDAVPTITWGANFHPRTDAETDFACEAGKRNVYWITEYAPNEFCVACWQATTGGNAQ